MRTPRLPCRSTKAVRTFVTHAHSKPQGVSSSRVPWMLLIFFCGAAAFGVRRSTQRLMRSTAFRQLTTANQLSLPLRIFA